jgi:nucleoid-associated protein YgaU
MASAVTSNCWLVYDRLVPSSPQHRFLQTTSALESGTSNIRADDQLHAAPKPSKELSRAEVEELRRLQAERAEIGQMKIMGLQVPKNMGVRRE